MKAKRRILFIGEGSIIATGFGTYWNEVIKRLYDTGSFEIAELASYVHDGDPKIQNVPWKFYPVAPHPNDKKGNEIYRSKPTNQFGEWIFDKVCLEWRPDIIAMIRDWWMDEFVLRSPLKNYATTVWMPTIDGEPQRNIWLDSYSQCDYILTYSEYGMNLLKKTGRPNTNLVTIASPGADTEVFKPVEDKKLHKKKLGLPEDSIIVGTVMRNQKRKLYKDLIEAFSGWVYKNKKKGHIDLVNKTFLYLHTSFPDVGYDIGAAVKEFKVGTKVILTYLCANCGSIFPYKFSGESINCLNCSKTAAHPPNAQHQCPREALAAIMNTFDLYVQYSVSEGWGMPLTEAMSCGVPCIAVNYSAMEDHLKCPTSMPIEVKRFFYEAIIETEQKRALPDNQDFIKKLDNFIKLSDDKKEAIRKKTREYVIEPVEVYGQDEKLGRRSWERTAAIWNNILLNCEIKDRNETWFYPRPRLISTDVKVPDKPMTNYDFVKWIICDVIKQPKKFNTYFAYEWITGLNLGYKIEGNQKIKVDRNIMMQFFINMINHNNQLEQLRMKTGQVEKTNELSISIL